MTDAIETPKQIAALKRLERASTCHRKKTAMNVAGVNTPMDLRTIAECEYQYIIPVGAKIKLPPEYIADLVEINLEVNAEPTKTQRFDKLLKDERNTKLLLGAKVRNALDLQHLAQTKFKYRLPVEEKNLLRPEEVAMLKTMHQKVWGIPKMPEIDVMDGRTDFDSTVKPISWEDLKVICKDRGVSLDVLASLHKAVAEIRFNRLHKSLRNREALIEANVTNAAELNAVASQRYVWKYSMAKTTKISKMWIPKLRILRRQMWAEPMVFTVGSVPFNKGVLVHIGQHWGRENEITEDIIQRHLLRSTMAKTPKSSIFKDSEETECQSEKFDNMQTVFFYKKTPSDRGDSEVRAAGKSIFNENNQLAMITHLILQIIGNCQLSYEEQLDGILMTALLTLHQKPQAAHMDYARESLLGRRRRPNARLEDGELQDNPFPWAADTPLSHGGLNLNIWHGHQSNAGFSVKENKDNTTPLENWNIKIHVPYEWMFLWRGDVVHGGGLQNGEEDGALRIHWYLPMKLDDLRSNSGRDRRVSREVDVGSDVPKSLRAICYIRE